MPPIPSRVEVVPPQPVLQQEEPAANVERPADDRWAARNFATTVAQQERPKSEGSSGTARAQPFQRSGVVRLQPSDGTQGNRKFMAQPAVQSRPVEQEEGGRRTGLRIVALLGFLLIGGGGAYVAIENREVLFGEVESGPVERIVSETHP